MTVNLRGHHLLCILTFAGYGYTRGFTENYQGIVDRLNAGETVLIVEGPDDICKPLLQEEEEPHCFKCNVRDRDETALNIVNEVLEGVFSVGDELVVSSSMVARLRKAFRAGAMKTACAGCEWASFCDDIAARNYKHTKFCKGPA